MKIKKIGLLTLAATFGAVALASCSNTGGLTPSKTTTTGDVTTTDDNTTTTDDAAKDNVLSYDEYVAAKEGEVVTISAYIQAKQAWWSNKGTFYLADADGAYFVYELPCTQDEYNDLLVVGAKIQVTGVKGSWGGELEILGSKAGKEATWEIAGTEKYTAPAKNLTQYAGNNDDLIAYQNQLAKFKYLEVVSVSEKAEGDDLYLELKKGDRTFTFCVEAYLTDANTDVYKTVKALEAGDVVNVTGFLYWYDGANTHITACEVVEDAVLPLSYSEYVATPDGTMVTVEAYVQDKQGWWEKDGVGVATIYLQNQDGAFFGYNIPMSKATYDLLVPGTCVEVYGYKTSWSGEIEIDGSKAGSEGEIQITGEEKYIAPAKDVTNIAADADELIKYQNQLVSVKGLKVVEVTEKADGDDLYLKLTDGVNEFDYCVESYLRGSSTDVYKTVKALKAGDFVNVTGYLYWYNGANTHIISVETASQYQVYTAAAMGATVTISAYVQDKQGWWAKDGQGRATFYLADADGAYFVYELFCTEEEYNSLVAGTKIKVTGVKGAWAGEVEILASQAGKEATWEIVEGDTYVAPAKDLTALAGNNAALLAYQNQYVAFNGLEVVEVTEKADGDDLYLKLKYNDVEFTFCVESYLRGANTDVYKAVKALQAGQKVNLTGFLYWYDGANTHITTCTVVTE